jgi:predicted GIY-YIG superfamily endonuclease|tara:strand:+ start:142 stop:504 length:363 start_codon:yes stop_codon:yes gene_type:complete
MENTEKTFYVGINDPAEIRKELLSCSKDIIGVLKNYDRVNLVREEKVEKIISLKKVLSELKRLSNMLKEKLPSDKVRAKTVVKKKVKKGDVKKTAPENKQISRLENELNEIESRLNNMTV